MVTSPSRAAQSRCELDGDDRIRRCTIALLGMGSTPIRATRAEAEIAGTALGDIDAAELGRSATVELEDVPSDLHGSAAYRTRVGAVMVARAFESASKAAAGGLTSGRPKRRPGSSSPRGLVNCCWERPDGPGSELRHGCRLLLNAGGWR